MLTDVQWAMLEPLIEAVRPPAKVPPQHLRRTISAILWRHDNGAKWRAVPAELGPWWMAAQTFIRWSRLNVWERLLVLVQEQGVQLGMTFLDGTSIPAANASRFGEHTKRRPGQPKRRHSSATGPSRSTWPLSWRLWHQGLRDCGRVWPRDRLCPGAGPGA